MRQLLSFTLLGIFLAFGVNADEVFFKSGESLKGNIVKVDGDTMTLDGTVAGKVALKMADIKTFTTDKPIAVVLADGSTSESRVAASEKEGEVVLMGSDEQKQPVELSAIGKINPDPIKWSGSVTLGLNFSRGNSRTETVNGSLDGVRRSDNDRSSLAAGYTHASQRDNDTRKDSTTADKWFVRGQYDYFLSKQAYLYANTRVEKDRIADLKLRVTPGTGIGYQWFESNSLKFSTESGYAYIYERYDEEPTRTEKNSALRLAYRAEKSLGPKTTLIHTLEYIPSLQDSDIYLINGDIALRTWLTGRLSLDLKAVFAYNSEPADDHKKEDWQYIAGFGWGF